MEIVLNKIRRRINVLLRRQHNKKTIYNYPAESGGWKKYRAPILGNKNEIYFDPFVKMVKDVFVMFVSYRNKNTIRITYSKNGIDWSQPFDIFSGRLGMWDSIVNRASFVIKDGRCYMWYTGQCDGISSIGIAVCEDGVHFKRYRSEPIITAEMEYEGVSVMNPCVIWDNEDEKFKMWYSAGENYEPDVVCYATSDNGIEWVKHRKNPVLEKGIELYDRAKVGGCEVLKKEDKYYMFYIGYENIDNARICEANSEDGINWKRLEYNPIIAPSKSYWDKHAVYKPTVILYRDNWLLWYNGRVKNREYIGFATKKYCKEGESNFCSIGE